MDFLLHAMADRKRESTAFKESQRKRRKTNAGGYVPRSQIVEESVFICSTCNCSAGSRKSILVCCCFGFFTCELHADRAPLVRHSLLEKAGDSWVPILPRKRYCILLNY